jgi:hypothetical protein
MNTFPNASITFAIDICQYFNWTRTDTEHTDFLLRVLSVYPRPINLGKTQAAASRQFTFKKRA